jgi:hypothetical protein
MSACMHACMGEGYNACIHTRMHAWMHPHYPDKDLQNLFLKCQRQRGKEAKKRWSKSSSDRWLKATAIRVARMLRIDPCYGGTPSGRVPAGFRAQSCNLVNQKFAKRFSGKFPVFAV